MPDVVGKIMGSNTGGGRKPFTYTPGGLDLSHIRQSARVKRYDEQSKLQNLNYNQPSINYDQHSPSINYNSQPSPVSYSQPSTSINYNSLPSPANYSQPSPHTMNYNQPPIMASPHITNYNQPPPWSPPVQPKLPTTPYSSNTLPKSKPKDTGFHVSVEELRKAKVKDDNDNSKTPYVLVFTF